MRRGGSLDLAGAAAEEDRQTADAIVGDDDCSSDDGFGAPGGAWRRDCRSFVSPVKVRNDDDLILRELMARASRAASPPPQFSSLAGARQYRRLHRLIERHLPAGAAVLDWGTGNGHFAYYLRVAGYRPTSFTIDGRSKEAWLDEPHEATATGDPSEPVRLPFPDAAFDAVASVGVLEHVRETGGSEAASLQEIARLLRSGGLFVCFHLPNHSSWIDLLASRVPGKHHHDYRYRRDDVSRLLAGAGLDLVELQRYALLPRNMLSRLPARLATSRRVADAWDAVDSVLGSLLSPLCQNWAFVASKGPVGAAVADVRR
jgi:SAM-dependent methyltransferase